MDVLGSSGLILRNLSLVQNNLGTDAHTLATGLRVNSAADDPSGYAIAQTIQSKVNGLQQSVQSVQTASNLLDVVDGALSNVELILQRVRSLVVESRSDINSLTDVQNIQTEINQLLLEINKISQNTTFNGLSLLGGNYDTGQGISNVPYGATQVDNLILAPGGYAGTSTVVNSQLPGYTGPGPLVVPGDGTPGSPGVPPVGSFTPALMIFQVLSYSDNQIDPNTGINVGPGVLVQFTAYSKSPSMGAAPTFIDQEAVPINSGPITSSYATPGSYSSGGGAPGASLFNFTIANLTQADVGATIAFISTNGTPPNPSGQALNVNDGGQEGAIVPIDIPSVSTNALNISDISVLPTANVNLYNQIIGQNSSNVVPAGDAEIRVDAALQEVNAVRAEIGAQTVSLQEDGSNDSITALNLTTTISNIRDANIGATVTDFTKQQILTQVGSQLLSQIEVSASALTSLLVGALGGGGATIKG